MSVLLRHPHSVPSLFSRGGEWDDAARRQNPLWSSPVAERIESFAAAIGLGGEETILGRGSRALAGTTIAVIAGLPLVKATQILLALSLPH